MRKTYKGEGYILNLINNCVINYNCGRKCNSMFICSPLFLLFALNGIPPADGVSCHEASLENLRFFCPCQLN